MLGSERKSVAELGTELVPWYNPLPQLQGNPSLTYACNSRSQLGYFFLSKTWGFSIFPLLPHLPMMAIWGSSFNRWLSRGTWIKPDRVKRETQHNWSKVTWPIHGREQLDFFAQNNISPTGLHIPREMGLDSPSLQQASSFLYWYSSVSCKENFKCLNNPSS